MDNESKQPGTGERFLGFVGTIATRPTGRQPGVGADGVGTGRFIAAGASLTFVGAAGSGNVVTMGVVILVLLGSFAALFMPRASAPAFRAMVIATPFAVVVCAVRGYAGSIPAVLVIGAIAWASHWYITHRMTSWY